VVVIDGSRLAAPAIFSWRIDDLPHLTEIEPDHVALSTVVDDDVTRTGVRVGLETPSTSRARERALQLPAVERHRFRRWGVGPRAAFVHDAGKGRAGQEDASTFCAEVDRIIVVEQRVRHWSLAESTIGPVSLMTDDADAVGFDSFREMVVPAMTASEIAARLD